MPEHPSLPRPRLFNKKHILWLLPIALLLAGCVIWGVPLTIFWEIVLLAWFTTLPGMLALTRVRLELSLLQRFVLGTALGFGIAPICFILLRMFDAWGYSSLLISVLNVASLLWLSLRGGIDHKVIEPTKSKMRRGVQSAGGEQIIALEAPRGDSHSLALLSSIAVVLVLLYNFTGIHYAADGSLKMLGLFAIDVPFLIGIMPSFDLTGHLADMHQGGITYAYHDFTYILIATVHQVAGTEYFSLISYSFPVFGLSVGSVALFALLKSFLESKRAVVLTMLALVLSSAWGDHLLTGALSPSYLAGVILLITLLILTREMTGHISPIRHIGVIGLIFLLLVILIKTKLPIFLLIGGSLGVLGLRYVKTDRRLAFGLLLPCILSLPLLLLFTEPNPFQPADDFVIGAPLMGYGNQLASVLHVDPSDVDPIVTPDALETEDLLIIPFTIIHLIRMILLDPRLLLFVIVVLFLRRTFVTPGRWMVTLAGAAIVLGIILPILYSPAWYPLAISFYTPELAGFVAGVVALTLIARSWNDALSRIGKAAIVLCLLYGAANFAYHVHAQFTSTQHSLSSEEVRSLEWVKQNTPDDAIIASNRYDLDLRDSTNDESFYLYAALSQRQVVSSGAKYGSLLAAVADVDTIKGLRPVEAAAHALTQRRMDVFTIYRSLNGELIEGTLDAYGVDYVLASRDPLTSTLDKPNADQQFETVNQSDELPVLRLKK